MIRVRPAIPTLFGAGACALASLAASVAWTSNAFADAPRDLEWTAPRECPSKAEIVERVGRLVGPMRPLADALRARTSVSKDERGGYHGEVARADDPESPPRRIDGDSCDAVAEAIVLILAIAVNPDAAMAAETTRTADAPVAPAGAVVAEHPEAAASAADRSRAFAVAGAGIVDSGLLGTVTPGAELAIGLRLSHVSLDVAGAFLATTHATLAERPNEGASATALQLLSRVCGAFGGDRFSAGPCLGAGISVISAHGFGAAQRADRGTTVPLGIVGGRASYRVAAAVAVGAELDAMLEAQRPTFVIDNAGTVARVPLATARLTGGVEMRF